MSRAWLFVGAKVIAVGGGGCDDPRESARLTGKYKITKPTIGSVYTVRTIREARRGLAITVAEIINPSLPPPDGQGLEADFAIENFAPLIDTTKTVEAMRGLMQKARDEKRVTVEA